MNKWAIALMAFGVTVGHSEAQWDYKQSWTNDRMGVTIANNVLDATTERATVVSAVSPIVSNVYYRSQYENCIAAKAKVKELIPHFVDTSKAENTGGTFNYNNFFTNMVTRTNHSLYAQTTNHLVINVYYLPMRSVSNICIEVGAPTNYFEFTSYRCLNGSGAFTNDATVGHPHGLTNEYTINGGTNFPGSRTNWYDTDYGWAPLYDMINLLVWTRHSEQCKLVWEKYPDPAIQKYGGQVPHTAAYVNQLAAWDASLETDDRADLGGAEYGLYEAIARYAIQKDTNGFFCTGKRVSTVPVVSNVAGMTNYAYDAQVYRSFGGLAAGADSWYQFDEFVPAFADINKFMMATNWIEQTTNRLVAVNPFIETMVTNPVLQIWPTAASVPFLATSEDTIEKKCLGESILGDIVPPSGSYTRASPIDYDHEALWLFKWNQYTNGFQFTNEP